MPQAEIDRIFHESTAKAAENRRRHDAAATPNAFGLPASALIDPDPKERIVPVLTETPEQAAARKEAQIITRLRQAGVPARYERASLADVANVPEDSREAWLAVAGKLVARVNNASILALCGNRGPGKTHMACALVREWCKQGRPARYVVAMDFFNAIRSQYAKADGDEAKILAQFVAPLLLVVDEIQVRGETDWENRMLTNLLDKRYAANRVTLLITNETEARLRQNIGDSAVDRIRDGGGALECNWKSLRGRVPAQRVEGIDDAR